MKKIQVSVQVNQEIIINSEDGVVMRELFSRMGQEMGKENLITTEYQDHRIGDTVTREYLARAYVLSPEELEKVRKALAMIKAGCPRVLREYTRLLNKLLFEHNHTYTEFNGIKEVIEAWETFKRESEWRSESIAVTKFLLERFIQMNGF